MIITLCGSARFESDFKAWSKALALEGHIPFSLAVYPSDEPGGKEWYTAYQKSTLDEVHKRKIELSDAILVLDREGYVGTSTRGEISHAHACAKQVFYASRVFEGVHGEAHLRDQNGNELIIGGQNGYAFDIARSQQQRLDPALEALR